MIASYLTSIAPDVTMYIEVEAKMAEKYKKHRHQSNVRDL